MGSAPAPLFFANLFLYFDESKWRNELKKNDLIKARKPCNIFRFINNLKSIKDGKFWFGHYDKGHSFPFSIVRMPDKSSNVTSRIVYSAIGAESLRIARASNNPESFSTAIKLLIDGTSFINKPLSFMKVIV